MATKLDHDTGCADAATASVTYHLPAQALRGAVTTYYQVKVTGPGTVWDQIFPEWPNFRLILDGDWEAHFPGEPNQSVPKIGMSGALEKALWAGGSAGVMVGVGLMPAGWPQLATASADLFTNRLAPLSEVIGPAADELYRRLRAAQGDAAIYAVLDEVLLSILTERPEAATVAAAHTALQDPHMQTVADWAEIVGLSSRQLERFSNRYFGMSPKRLLRRQRLLRTLAAMREAPEGTWTQFLDDQFTDQAHFIHEFNYYMGLSPSAYLARDQPFMAEAWKRRKALLGSPVQVLQPPENPAA
ncbi:AraC family transcriptional regulator [Phenylobacterium sp.]|uniref:helix-turn-helix domain-containing protein n=1 Tax=Phenylobacterium sp. TaxID=1871053 RepID=UPI00120084C3|nr:helix-turn-helix domain-containing protein [Phenylobacterium sp.]THD58685.1 MAG: AraC family transcriptional regulator [Phenylobacterium sp.]